ncbi:MAG: hypothetical protein ACRDFQ_00740 [Anaerolineales bacterium]
MARKRANPLIFYLILIFSFLLTACGGEAAIDLSLDGQNHQASESVPQMSLLSLLIVLTLAMTAAVLAAGRSS